MSSLVPATRFWPLCKERPACRRCRGDDRIAGWVRERDCGAFENVVSL